MNTLRKTLGLAACLMITPLIAQAQQVTVSSNDNAVSITGQLLSFDDEVYVLETDIGILRLSRTATDCIGADCPVLT